MPIGWQDWGGGRRCSRCLVAPEALTVGLKRSVGGMREFGTLLALNAKISMLLSASIAKTTE